MRLTAGAPSNALLPKRANFKLEELHLSEKALVGSLIIGQSGGPSAVINCSAYGVIKAGLENPNITRVYGAHHGIKGVLNDDLMIMDE